MCCEGGLGGEGRGRGAGSVGGSSHGGADSSRSAFRGGAKGRVFAMSLKHRLGRLAADADKKMRARSLPPNSQLKNLRSVSLSSVHPARRKWHCILYH